MATGEAGRFGAEDGGAGFRMVLGDDGGLICLGEGGCAWEKLALRDGVGVDWPCCPCCV